MSQMTDEGDVPELTLPRRMRLALDHAGVGVDEMADVLGVTRQTIGRWTHGHGTPKQGFLRLWALRTGVSYSWLAGGDTPGKTGRGSRNLRS